ncbi:MAG: hypothetical protein PCFJNLEI_00314 [Verrucomicrobiae bacterium]|nr:hypothetical protein [Verrucomicrobiae bacterium]
MNKPTVETDPQKIAQARAKLKASRERQPMLTAAESAAQMETLRRSRLKNPPSANTPTKPA